MNKILIVMVIFLLSLNSYGQKSLTSEKYILNGVCTSIWWFENPQIHFEKFSNDSLSITVRNFGSYTPMIMPVSIKYSIERNFNHKDRKWFTPIFNKSWNEGRTSKMSFPENEQKTFMDFIRKNDTLWLGVSSPGGNQHGYFLLPNKVKRKIKKFKGSKSVLIFGTTPYSKKPIQPILHFERFKKDSMRMFVTKSGSYNYKKRFKATYWFDKSIDSIGKVWNTKSYFEFDGSNTTDMYVMKIEDRKKYWEYLNLSNKITVQYDTPKLTLNLDFELTDEIKKELKRYVIKPKRKKCWCPE
jgi:hypothetical protein